MPPAEQIRTALEKVLASDCFARSERARELLRYLVEQDLSGNAERLKGFSIGVDVFGKGETFDPATDTVVRVQAGRLREFLTQYYSTEGRDDPLHIIVPRGSYVPSYEPSTSGATAHDARYDAAPAPQGHEAPSAAATPVAEPAAPANRSRIGLFLGLGVLAAAAAGLWLTSDVIQDRLVNSGLPFGASEASSQSTASVKRNELPHIYLKVDENDPVADQIATALRRGLIAFDTVHFIAKAPSIADAGAPGPLDFVFIVDRAGERGEVHLELQNAQSRKVLFSRVMQAADMSSADIEDGVADILSSIAPSSGAVYTYLGDNGIHTPLTYCLVRNERYYFEQREARHREAYECLSRLAETKVHSSLVLSELASLNMQAFVNGYEYPPDASPAEALNLARMAIQLAPNSPRAHRALGYVLSRSGDIEDGLAWSRKAYELNRFDLGVAASYGYALIRSGAYQEGTAILDRAVRAASAHPGWWDYGLFLGHFMLGQAEEAAQAASTLGASDQPHHLMARVVAAAGRGRAQEAAMLLLQLQSKHPAFMQDPQRFFADGNYTADMTNRLLTVLRAAGRKNAS